MAERALRLLALFAASLLLAFALPTAAIFAADEPAKAALPPTLSIPPDEAAQASATKLIHDLFGQQIEAAKTSFAKDDLAKKLLQQGIDSKADPAGQFVLLKMARDLAVGVGDTAVALQSVDETARVFRIDALALRQETLANLAKIATNPVQSRALSDAVWSALDDAIAADNFEVAKLLLAQGAAAAKRTREADLSRQWTLRGKEIDEIQSAYEAVRPSEIKLRQKPLDADANLAFGRYLAVVKGDWDKGLPMIALSKQSPLQALAIAEMAPPDDPESQLKLADGWWDFAETATDAAEKERLQGRALFWYGQAMPNLQGLPKIKVEKRLQEVMGKVLARIQAAVRHKNVVFTPAVPATSRPSRAGPFVDGPDEGGLLVGLEIGLGVGNGGGQYIRAVRPIFFTSRGEMPGSMHGRGGGDMITVRAREGFAVGALSLRAGNRIDGLSVTFMQIQGIGLNPRNSYTSDWYGGRSGAISTRLGGSGAPLVGIAGKADNSLQELALVGVKGQAPGAKD